MQMVVELVTTQSDDALIQEAQEVLRNWDGNTVKESRGAALAIITGTRAMGYEYIETESDPLEMLKKRPQSLKSALAVLILNGVKLTVSSAGMSIYR